MRVKIFLCLALILAVAGGCQKPVHFPVESLSGPADRAGAIGAYDVNHDGKAGFFTFGDSAGRVVKIAYDNDGDEMPDTVIDLNLVAIDNGRHLVVMLDGFGYEVIKQYYDAGGLRMFHPPSKVISPYPALTDMCMGDVMGYIPSRAFEARYFDRKVNSQVGGASSYLVHANAPWHELLQYRIPLMWDAVGYIAPWELFGKEVNDAKRLFDKAETKELLAYFTSSAGVGTRLGADGQRKCLQRLEQLFNQILYETRGLTRITLLSDHGHSYIEATEIPLQEHLTDRGWRLTKSLHHPTDAVYIRFGLETYASFATNSPSALARDLVDCEGVELVSFVDTEAVVVLSPKGKATIRKKDNRYSYESTDGDPLKLKAILASLSADSDGYYDADELFAATSEHEFPAPLQRLWRAHFALVENPADVIVSLADRFYSGSSTFAGIVTIASTHGSLNLNSSTTFIMSTAGPLPPLMRSREIPPNMSKLLNTTWPMGK